MTDVEITPVRAAHQFDQGALHRFLEGHVDGYAGPLQVRQFEGGQSNPTFLLETPTRQYVLRKQPPGELLPSAHQVDREFRVMGALQGTDVPVPQMFALCDDVSIIGTRFYVMEFIDGRLFTDNLIPTLNPTERREVYLDLARVLAQLHAVQPASVDLESFGRPGNYYERQISRWTRQYLASQTEDIESMTRLIEWLPQHIPDAGDVVVVHGDYRLGNVLLHPTEPCIIAVLDWELSTLGDGLADLGYLCQQYYGDPADPTTLAGSDLAALGVPDEAELVDTYCKAANRGPIDNWPFYLIYNLFRSAGIIQGVYKRGLDGNASSEQAMEHAGVARQRGDRAWSLVEQL